MLPGPPVDGADLTVISLVEPTLRIDPSAKTTRARPLTAVFTRSFSDNASFSLSTLFLWPCCNSTLGTTRVARPNSMAGAGEAPAANRAMNAIRFTLLVYATGQQI